MKIAIVSDDGKTISAHFGRSRGFVIFEIEDSKVKNQEYRENTFTGHARGLEGKEHAFDRHAPIQSDKLINEKIKHRNTINRHQRLCHLMG